MSEVLTVYLDVLFITNGAINSALLLIAYRFLGIKPQPLGFSLGVFLATAYGLTVCLPGMSFFTSTFFKTLSAILISFAAFAPHVTEGLRQSRLRGAIRLGKCACVFAFVSFAYGAAVTSFQYAPFAKDALYVNNGEIYYNVPVPYLLLAILILLFAQSLLLRVKEKRSLISGTIPASFIIGGRKQELFLLADSGNLARDPLSGAPVVFVDRERLKILPKEAVKVKDVTDLFCLLSECKGLERRLSLISCSTASGRGICAAFRPESFLIGNEDVKALIALPLDGKVSGEGFDGIFNPNVLTQKGDVKCSEKNIGS